MRRVRKLLACMTATALLASLTPAMAAGGEELDLLEVLEMLYGMEDGIALMAETDEEGAGSPEHEYKCIYDTVNSAKVSIGSAQVGEDGKVKVPVSVTGQAGLNGAQVTISYGEGLTYLGVELSEDFYVCDVREAAGDNTFSLVVGNADNVDGTTAELATLVFDARDVVPGTTAQVSGEVTYVTYRGADSYNEVTNVPIYTTLLYQNQNVTVESGTVTATTRAVITIGTDGMTASAGSKITVPISIDANYPDGVNGIQMVILYDANILSIGAADIDDELVMAYSAAEAMMLSGDGVGIGNSNIEVDKTTDDAHFVNDADDAKVKAIVATEEGQLMLWANDENIKLNGTIAELTFTVKQDVEPETSTKVDGDIAYVSYALSDDEYKVEYELTSVVPGTITVIAPTYVLGDVNGDGVVNSNDAVLILQYVAKIADESDLILDAGDVNGDGKVDSNDAVLILQLVAKIVDENYRPLSE